MQRYNGTLPTRCFESSTGLANRLRICTESIPDQGKCVVRLYDTLNLGSSSKKACEFTSTDSDLVWSDWSTF